MVPQPSHKAKTCGRMKDRPDVGAGQEEYRGRTLCFTLSNESGVSTEKPINMTWALEYASGRNRS